MAGPAALAVYTAGLAQDLAAHALVLQGRAPPPGARACDRALATGDPKPHDAIAEVLTATADLADRNWLDANTGDPDVSQLRLALRDGRRVHHRHYQQAQGGGAGPAPATADVTQPDVAALDELLSRVLWTRFGPA